MPGASNLGDVLNKTLCEMGLEEKAHRYMVFAVWPRVVGEISKNAKPRWLRDDVLFVATSSSVWSQELTFMKQDILNRLNRALGGSYVREIRFSEHLWSDRRGEGGHSTTLNEGRSSGWDGTDLAGDLRAGGAQSDAAGAAFLMKNSSAAGSLANADLKLKPTGDPLLDRAFARAMRAMLGRRGALLRRGSKLCPSCGYVYPGRLSYCPMCRDKHESRSYLAAIAILEKNPGIPTDKLAGAAGFIDKRLADRAKKDVESRLLAKLRRSIAEVGRPGLLPTPLRLAQIKNEVVPLVRRLACLRTAKSEEEISLEEAEKAVGRRLAGYLKREGQKK